MTPDVEREKRANFILRNAEQYGNNPLYAKMVDNTVFLTPEQKEKSQLEVDRVYGWRRPVLEVALRALRGVFAIDMPSE